ncbi:DUF6541 family protein [Actinokineospora guangxiensis]|uniref:DUF6541 family protein n=1 Tax=Actinokineospora guangxiensis TaxID=1490288 RepID=A0ABW0EIQ0_9PSEU
MGTAISFATGALATALALVFLPGYLVLRSWAVTGLVAVAAAAPVSIGLLGTAALAAPALGVGFGPLLLLGPAVAAAAVGLLVRSRWPKALGAHDRVRRPARSRWPLLAHLGALLIPAAVIGSGVIRMIGSPDNVSQTYDASFHFNAVRYILDTGSGSALTLGGMYTEGARPSPYPAAWHDVVALVVEVSGSSIPTAANAVTLVVAALVWPLSMIFLVTRVTGVRPVPVLLAGAVSTIFGTYPMQSAEFGMLYPYFLSLSLLPVGLGLITMATGVGDRGGTPRWVAALALLAVVPAVALAHPSSVLGLSLLAVPVFVVAVVRFRRVLAGRAGAGRYWLLVSLLGAYLLAGVVVWLRMRPSAEASGWLIVQTPPEAVWELLTAGLLTQPPTWLAFGLTLVAIGLALRRKLSQWVTGAYLIVAVLFVVVSSVDPWWFRTIFTGVWYNDPVRLAALVPAIAVVACTLAAVWLFNRVRELRERGSSHREATPGVAAAAFGAAAVLAVAGQFGSVGFAVGEGVHAYQPGPDGSAPLLSTDERALLERLDQHVPAGEKIMGYAWNGSAFSYALGGRRTLTPHLAESSVPADVDQLMRDLDRIDTDPAVCELVQRLDARYALHFPGPVLWDRERRFRGLEAIASNPRAVEVDREGDAVLYRITGCGDPG